jgi:hypothetical protein
MAPITDQSPDYPRLDEIEPGTDHGTDHGTDQNHR